MTLPSNIWESPVIKKRLAMEASFECDRAGKSHTPLYYVLAQDPDDNKQYHVIQNYKEDLSHIAPHSMQIEFIKGIQTKLQKEIGFGGLWMAGFTHPPSKYGVLTDTENCWNRMIFIWHDEDGDPQYTVESDMPFVEQLEAGVDYYVGLAFQAHDQWKEHYSSSKMKTDMMLSEDQQIKGAQQALKDA